MSNQKTSKRTLTANIMILLTCIAMLIVATYAWFTDSASTGVNKIQAGKLDVALEMYQNNAWVSAEGQTIDFIKADGSSEILWEPGCTYTLPALRVKNIENLALKYKIEITGIKGDAKLNEAIEWTIGDAALGTEQHLAVGETAEFTIEGHMKEDAGNEYQGLSIDGISITVVATQDTVESDSISNQYDKNAVYPVAPVLGNATETGTIKANEETTLGNMSDTESPSAAQITIPANATDQNIDKAVFTMSLTSSNPDSVSYEISLKDANGDSIQLSKAATVTTNIGAGLSKVQVNHNGTAMSAVNSSESLTDGTYYYNKSTGQLWICTSTFSPFTISYKYEPTASVNGTGYTSIQAAINAAQDGDTVVLTEDSSYPILTFWTKNITLDLNGKTLSSSSNYNNLIQIVQSSNVTIKNGTLKPYKYGISIFYDNNNLTLDNVKIEANDPEGIAVFGTSNYNTISLNNCEIKSNYFGVYQNGSYEGNTFVLTNSKITDTNHTAVYISNSAGKAKQNLTISNCTITGPSAVEMKHTNADISNSTLIGTATPTGSGTNNNGACTSGYALAVTTNGENDLVTGNVNVTGCKYYSGSTTDGDSNGYIFVYKVADGSSVTIDGESVTNYNTYGGETE